MKYGAPSALGKKLSPKQFILSIFLIFAVSLTFLFGLFFILNIQHQKPKELFSNGPVTSLPKTLRLDLEQPDNDYLTFQSTTQVSGKTAPLSNVLISTENQDLVIKSKPDGSFSTVLDLDEGVNNIVAVVFDSTGDWRSDTRTIYYSKEKI